MHELTQHHVGTMTFSNEWKMVRWILASCLIKLAVSIVCILLSPLHVLLHINTLFLHVICSNGITLVSIAAFWRRSLTRDRFHVDSEGFCCYHQHVMTPNLSNVTELFVGKIVTHVWVKLIRRNVFTFETRFPLAEMILRGFHVAKVRG
jgi:hypothetical protein